MLLLEIAFVRSDFSYSLVQRYSSTDTPLFYKLTAMWSSQEGSLLLWVFLLSVYSSVVLFATRWDGWVGAAAALVPWDVQPRRLPRCVCAQRIEIRRSRLVHRHQLRRAAAHTI